MHSNSKGHDDEEALLEALLLLHRKKTQAVAPRGAGEKFSRVVEHFEHRARRLEREKRTTQQLLGYMTPRGDIPPVVAKPGVLEIVGKLGAHAVGHVRLVNESEDPVSMFWVVGLPLSRTAAPPVRFTPNPIQLASGQSGFVEISADLSNLREASSITLPLECRSVARLERLQLIIRAEGPT